jgi:hypothetical protein
VRQSFVQQHCQKQQMRFLLGLQKSTVEGNTWK